MTKRWTRLAALLIVAILALSGCSMITVDQEMDRAENVAEYNGGKITKGEVTDFLTRYAVNFGVDSAEELLEIYSMYYGVTAEELYTDVINVLVMDNLLRAKAEELGVLTLTDEEKEKAHSDAQATYDEIVTYYTSLNQDGVISDEEAKKQAVDNLTAQGITLDYMRNEAETLLWSERLKAELTKDVTITDEELEEAYQDQLTSDQDTYTADPSSYEQAAMEGEMVTYVPEGVRQVKHILLMTSDEQANALSLLESELESARIELEEYDEANQSAEDEYFTDEEQTPDSTEAPASTEAPTTTDAPAGIDSGIDPDVMDDDGSNVDTQADRGLLVNRVTELETQVAEKKAECVAELQPKLDEIMARVDAGEDFDALIAEYGEDPGMRVEPALSKGYPIVMGSTSYDQAFTDASMALEKVGDVGVSELGSFGVHIIKYIADTQAGPIPFDTVKEELKTSMLTELKDEKYTTLQEQWIADANVKTHLEHFK